MPVGGVTAWSLCIQEELSIFGAGRFEYNFYRTVFTFFRSEKVISSISPVSDIS